MKYPFKSFKSIVQRAVIFIPLGLSCTPVERDFGGGSSSASSGASSSSGGAACTSDAECPTSSDPFCTKGGCSPEGICIILPANEGMPCPEGSCHNGACLCPQEFVQCNGVCVDISMDSMNCGACGHDCLGSACSDGLCVPALIASGQGGAKDIAANAEGVVWSNSASGEVMLYRKADNTLGFLAKGQPSPGPLALDAGNIYWANQAVGNGAIMKIPFMGGQPTQLASTQNPAIDIAVGTANVFWIEFDGNIKGWVRRVSLMGGGVNNLFSNNADPRALDVLVGEAYWTNALLGEESIMQSSGAMGTKTLVSGLGNPANILIAQNNIYFIDMGFATLNRVSLMGGQPEKLYAGPPWPRHIAADAKHIYWTQDDGAVMRLSTAMPGMPETVARNNKDLGAIAVDDTHVYWIDNQSEIYGTVK